MCSGRFNNLLKRVIYVRVIPARIEKIKPVADDGPTPVAVKYTTNIKLSPAVMGALNELVKEMIVTLFAGIA